MNLRQRLLLAADREGIEVAAVLRVIEDVVSFAYNEFAPHDSGHRTLAKLWDEIKDAR